MTQAELDAKLTEFADATTAKLEEAKTEILKEIDDLKNIPGVEISPEVQAKLDNISGLASGLADIAPPVV